MKSRVLSEGQEAAVSYAFERDYSIMCLPVGYGKTVIALTAIKELLDAKVLRRVLVIAPLSVCKSAWAGEARLWSHLSGLTVAVGCGDLKTRTAAVESRANVVVLNPEAVPWLRQTYRGKLPMDGLVIDELTRFKSPGSAGVRAMRALTERFKWRLGLTATPVAQDVMDLYAQALVIDGGTAFGQRFDRYRSRYFLQLDYKGYKWELLPGALEEITSKLAGWVMVVDEAAYQSELPGLTLAVEKFTLPERADRQYGEMVRDMLVDDDTEIANLAVLTGKLQQVCQGWVYRDDGEVLDVGSDKWAWIKARLRDAVEPVVVVYQYREDLRRLEEMLPGLRVLSSQGDVAGTVKAWNAGEIPVMALNPRAAGHGLNLQAGGREMILLGPIWSRDQYDQVIGRLWRRGQTRAVTVTILAAEGTVETEVMLPRLEAKGDTQAAFKNHLWRYQQAVAS